MKKIITLVILLISCTITAQKIDQKLADLGIELPKTPKPLANYVNAVRVDNTIYLSGKGPRKADGTFITGKVGQDMTIEEAQQAARLTGINQLAALKETIGNLDKVKRIVKVFGMVNCTTDFTQQPKVINGFSDLMVEVFGEKGRHARSAVGMGSLPANIPVEIEMIVEVEE
jgi:enamine deaminase RidA (YjgF/YER057c/UK114 family)